MIQGGIQAFAGQRVLLLQGPVGPFFRRLSNDLRSAGAEVSKVNFNAGDWFWFQRGALNYRGTMEDWPAWFEALILRLRIDVVMLFGDCRPVHAAAHEIASRYRLEIGVFEEGYVRPDWVTLERFGVNGRSSLPRTRDAYDNTPPAVPSTVPVGNTYWPMAWFSFWYYAFGGLGKPLFRHYRHHRPLTLLEAFPWIRSAWRKLWYSWVERGAQAELAGSLSKRYFLVPLQTPTDSQVTVHASPGGNEHFIETTIRSFAKKAPEDTWLVLKHHPMARGYTDRTVLIRRLANEAGVRARVHYIHDQHLPTLLDNARGVVVLNSTVGLSAIHHGVPTKACGTALYDIPGLCYQGSLDDFWSDAPEAIPDRKLYRRFLGHVIARSQLNGSFYKRLKSQTSATGLIWRSPLQIVESAEIASATQADVA